MVMINCLNCGQLMLAKPIHLCSNCIKVQQEGFKKIKAYLANHPRASLMEVQQMTGVSLKTIGALLSDQPIHH